PAAVSGWAMQGGVTLARALTSHALRVLADDPMMETLRYVLSRVLDMDTTDAPRTMKRLHDAVRGRGDLQTMEDLSPWVDGLIARDCMRLVPVPRKGAGRPPSPI